MLFGASPDFASDFGTTSGPAPARQIADTTSDSASLSAVQISPVVLLDELKTQGFFC
jgi:hypothetical protein